MSIWGTFFGKKKPQTDVVSFRQAFQTEIVVDRKPILSGELTPLNLSSKGVLSDDDMNKLCEALRKAPLLTEQKILEEIQPDRYKDTVEGNLEQVLARLTEFKLEDSKRPEFIGVRANWVKNEYVNVSTWLRPPNATNTTVWNLMIVRTSDDVYRLFA